MALNRAKVLETADKLVKQGKLDEAIKHYIVLSEDNPRDVNTINRIGDLYVRLRKNKEGIRQFMRIADFYAGDGFHLKAIAMYKKITKLEPSHVEANQRLAEMYAKQGLGTEARTQFVALAEHCLKAGQKDKALELYSKALEVEPGNVKIRLILAEIHARDGDQAQAATGLLAVAGDLKKRGMTDEALKVLQKASKLQPSNPEVLAEMAAVLQVAGKNPQEALGVLESLHEGEPGNPRYVQMLGEAYLGAGRAREFQRLLASAPVGEPRIGLMEAEARHLSSNQHAEQAKEKLKEAAEEALKHVSPERGAGLLESALRLDPGDIQSLESLLEVWSKAAHRDGMISALERLSEIKVRRMEWDEASRLLDRLLDLAPESKPGRELREKVASARKTAVSGRESLAEEATSVPSLEELEKVVELEATASDDPAEVLSIEGMDSDLDLSAEPAAEEVEDEEAIQEQERAYSGKSVIQEMRGDPARPEVDEDFLNEHFTEAEVFLKYGLLEKAREQLQTILDRYAEHLPSLMKMKEVLAEEGRGPDAGKICRKVAALLRGKGDDEKASEWEEEATRLFPGASPEASAPKESLASVLQDLEIPDTISLGVGSSSQPAAKADSKDEVDRELLLSDEEPGTEMSIELVDETESASERDDAIIADRISQLEFSLQQGLREEAHQILRDLESSVPSHPEVAKLKKRLQAPVPASAQSLPVTGGDLDMDVEMAFGSSAALQPGAGDPGSETAIDGEGFFDLAAELKAHAVDSTPGSPDPGAALSPREEASIDEIFKAFRKKVEQQVEEEDYETRYNLGIAYKEMGLLDEAIGEFQYASREPKLFLECCSILGICFREKGMSDLAIKWYRKALASPGQPEEKQQGLRYDLAELHLERGEFSQALSLFSEVYGVNSNYRDVASRIRELKKRVG